MTRFVGFAPSKKQPLPGANVLATAIERFSFVKQGVKQGANASSQLLQD